MSGKGRFGNASNSDHPVILRGLTLRGFPRSAGDGGAPTLLQRLDQDFITAVQDEVTSDEGRSQLLRTLAGKRDKEGHLRLFQPVHRTFHVALLEVVCDRPGEPRLDPESIDSAGLVIRRGPAPGRSTSGGQDRAEGWMNAGAALRGWVPLGSAAEQDPDPANRRGGQRSGHPEIDRRLSLLRAAAEPLEETTSPLFVAPPEICKAAGRTLLYGVVPTTSAELSEAPEPEPTLTEAQIEAHLTLLLKNRHRRGPGSYGWLGRILKADDVDKVAHMATLLACVEQLHVEFDAFGSSAESRAFKAVLDEISLSMPDGGTRSAGRVLKEAAQVFLDRSRTSVRLPTAWPALSSSLRRRIVAAARTLLEARLAAIAPGEGRYDTEGRSYQLRAFVRVKKHPEKGAADTCPPELTWSASSDAFTIAPWYDSSDAPPVQIALPDATDRGFLAGLKPNVAFAVPESLFDQIRGSKLADLLEGKAGGGNDDGGGIGLGWICGFNIPIITLCAFFVLNIFLSLLNIVFFWLPFVKICIPFPKKT